MEKELSTLQERLAQLEKNEKELNIELTELRDYFLGVAKVEAIFEPEKFLGRLNCQVWESRQQQTDLKERLQQIDEAIKLLTQKVLKLQNELQRNKDKKDDVKSWLNEYEQEKAELEELAVSFGKESIHELQKELDLLINRESVNKLKKEVELGRVRQKKAISGERGCYVPNQELLQLFEVLNETCDFVQPGVDWLASVDYEEKIKLIHRMPFLPYSVIVNQEAFARIKNGKLKFTFTSDFTIPIVNVEALRKAREFNTEDIFYTCDCVDLVTDQQRFTQYLAGINGDIKKIETEINSTEEKISELKELNLKVMTFGKNYPNDKVERYSADVRSYEERIASLVAEIKQSDQESARLNDEKNSTEGQAETLEKAINNGEEEIAKVELIIQKSALLISLTEKISNNKRESTNINNKLVLIGEKKKQVEDSLNEVGIQIEEKGKMAWEVERDLKELLSFESIEAEVFLDDAKASYTASHDAVAGKNIQESDLRDKIDIGENQLETLKNRVMDEYETDVKKVEHREKNGEEINIPSRSTILAFGRERRDLSEELTAKGREVNDVTVKIRVEEEKLKLKLENVPKEEQVEIPCYEHEGQYKREIEDAKHLIKSLKLREDGLRAESEELKEQQGKTGNQLVLYEGFLEREGIVIDAVQSEVKEYRVFEREYQAQTRQLQGLHDKWVEKLKVVEKETTTFVIREPLEELSKIGMPLGVVECRKMQNQFAEYILNLEEQMQKVNSDILQLESYQKEFSSRCIKRAELILNDLNKLESLSKIDVYGRRVAMIKVKLNEFEEQDKQLRMKTHIDNIVKEIEQEGAVDRQRVATRLATRELLAQIVDLEKASVKLYKVESIPEHSKHYRWENALGSEGQNNSLYFIFAVCLISYIRMLSINNVSVNTKKVIIADNPFGSTSAVYLWDPMFKILKQNNIQLIAPGHRIPQEITSRFSVNYLLNQEIMQNGKTRVVVKDVRVEEDDEYLRYIEPEQMGLFD